MRYFRYGFLAILAVVLTTVALANRGEVMLHLLPEAMAGNLGYNWSMPVPLFVIILASIIAGILIGFVWEWFREHRQRAEAAANRRERDRLAREVARLKGPSDEKGDDVLAILDKAG